MRTRRDTITMTSILDGHCHWVLDDAVATGAAEGHGVYEALCGHRLTPTPMICPDGPFCARCELVMYSRRTMPDVVLDPSVRRRRHRRPGLLRRMLTSQRRT